MFAKPEIGKFVTALTDWADVFATYATYVQATQSRKTVTGKVIESEHYDDPASFRILTNNAGFPVSIIPLERIVELTYEDGTKAVERSAVTLSDSETWEVPGSNGSYIVSRRGSTWHCECKGWQFRKQCRHVNAKKQEVLDR